MVHDYSSSFLTHHLLRFDFSGISPGQLLSYGGFCMKVFNLVLSGANYKCV